MKRIIYLIATIFLGVILSYLAHALIEIIYLRVVQPENIYWDSYFGVAGCALPWYLQYGLLITGIVGGFFLGRYWWRIVYVEKKHF